jgi:hypothetical protein
MSSSPTGETAAVSGVIIIIIINTVVYVDRRLLPAHINKNKINNVKSVPKITPQMEQNHKS